MYNRCGPGDQNGNPGLSRSILTVMSKSCSCDGTNENCMFWCRGRPSLRTSDILGHMTTCGY